MQCFRVTTSVGAFGNGFSGLCFKKQVTTLSVEIANAPVIVESDTLVRPYALSSTLKNDSLKLSVE